MPTITRACIPEPLQIVLDDVGWWLGAAGARLQSPDMAVTAAIREGGHRVVEVEPSSGQATGRLACQ